MVSTVATQSRIASLTASFSVRLPDWHGLDLGAEQPHAEHVERLALDVDLAHVDLALHARAARPRWRWPRRAGRRRSRRRGGVLPIRLASSAWPSTLLILCEPVWLRSSRLSSSRRPSSLAEVVALGERRRPAGVVAQQRRRARRGTPGRPTPRGTPPPAPRTPARASRARSARRTRRSGRSAVGSPINDVGPSTVTRRLPSRTGSSSAPAVRHAARRRGRAR